MNVYFSGIHEQKKDEHTGKCNLPLFRHAEEVLVTGQHRMNFRQLHKSMPFSTQKACSLSKNRKHNSDLQNLRTQKKVLRVEEHQMG
jgi:hypothetical protein